MPEKSIRVKEVNTDFAFHFDNFAQLITNESDQIISIFIFAVELLLLRFADTLCPNNKLCRFLWTERLRLD